MYRDEPKDVIITSGEKLVLCPNCKYPFNSLHGYVNYCSNCGQRLCWRPFWKLNYPNLVDENGDLLGM